MSASWAEHAACSKPGVDPELFFPVSESGPALRQVAEAKAICARCPVAAPCREWAMRAGEPAGVWGGTTAGERQLLRARPLSPRPGAGSRRRRGRSGSFREGREPVKGRPELAGRGRPGSREALLVRKLGPIVGVGDPRS